MENEFEKRMDAIVDVGLFLKRLMDPKRTPRIPKRIRREASALLSNHYPSGMSLRWMHDLQRIKARLGIRK